MTGLQKADLTQAETALIENHAALDTLPGHENASTAAARAAAMAAFKANGLPSRRMESWHYTDLRTQLVRIPATADAGKAVAAPPLMPQNTVLSVVNGKAVAAGGLANAFFTPFAEMLGNGRAELEEEFAADNVIGQLNTAFVTDGWKIDIPDEASPGKIIELQNIQNGAHSHVRFPVHIGKNAHVMILERQIGSDAESFVTSLSHLDIAEGAQVSWMIIRERGMAASELNRFSARLGKDARLNLYIINAGCRLLRQEIDVDIQGSGADFQLRGINLLSGKTHTDTTMTTRHQVEATTSTQIMRNVVTDEARGVFQGMIRVAQIAQKTDARMACNSLILSDNAEFDAKPELEIFADDVACGHGATVAEIDHDHLFYLMARGIPQAQARAMLVKAFVGELIDELDSEDTAHALQSVLDRWLQKHI